MASYVIKTEILKPHAKSFVFHAQKQCMEASASPRATISSSLQAKTKADEVLSREGFTSVKPIPRKPELTRQTPRVTVAVECDAIAKRPVGRSELKRFDNWTDGRAKTELNFKLYRQATSKIAGISDAAALFLDTFFD